MTRFLCCLHVNETQNLCYFCKKPTEKPKTAYRPTRYMQFACLWEKMQNIHSLYGSQEKHSMGLKIAKIYLSSLLLDLILIPALASPNSPTLSRDNQRFNILSHMTLKGGQGHQKVIICFGSIQSDKTSGIHKC